MKKLIMSLCLAGALCAAADAPAAKPAGDGGAPRKSGAPTAERPNNLTPEQRRERREKFMQMMKERQAVIQGKVVEALKEVGLDEAKAKATAEKIDAIYRENRRPPMMGGRPGPGGHRPGGPRRKRPDGVK